jgi:arginase
MVDRCRHGLWRDGDAERRERIILPFRRDNVIKGDRLTIHILSVPFDLGHPQQGMGLGPARLMEGGMVTRLRGAGHTPTTSTIDVTTLPKHEVGAAFAINVAVATEIQRIHANRARPLVLAGNCNHALGAVGGIASRDVGVVWFDGHGDFNTPSTTESGFFDGFALNMVVGGSWQAMTALIPGFHPVAESSVLLTGVRDLDPSESDLLRASAVTVLDGPGLERGDLGAFEQWCREVARRVDTMYVHVDLDVVNRELAPANRFSPPGGLHPECVRDALAMVSRAFDIPCASLASYDPSADEDDRALEVGLDIAGWLAAGLVGQPVRMSR